MKWAIILNFVAILSWFASSGIITNLSAIEAGPIVDLMYTVSFIPLYMHQKHYESKLQIASFLKDYLYWICIKL